MEQQKLFDFIAQCKGYINKEIALQNWNNVLALVSTTASIIYESNLYYFDEDLENAIALVAKRLNLVPENYKANEDLILYYDGFGLNNRGLVQIYLEALCSISDKKHLLYVAPKRMQDKIPDIKVILDRAGAEAFFLEGKDYLTDITKLKQLIDTKHPGHFFFYSTPGDVVGTVILNAYEGKLRRYQINLTDHSFWLGAMPIDVCIEFRDYGANVSHEYRKIPKEKIVKIPYYPIVRDMPFQGYPFPIKEGQKVVFSGGSLYKTNGGEGKYYKIVEYILVNHPDVIFWYAGTYGSGDSTQLEELIKRYPDRVFWTEERKDLLQVMKHSRFYLSTYPMIGGLMSQYAARAGIVPISLTLDNISKGLFINESELRIYFQNTDDMLKEIDILLNDSEYANKRGHIVSEALISPQDFNDKIVNLLKKKKSVLSNDAIDVLDTTIVYSHIDTLKFCSIQINNYTEEKLSNAIATRHNAHIVKYFPAKFVRGGGTEDSEENKEHYEISFILTTYNSSFERIRKTLVSFLEQEDVCFEIIVTDDGSNDNHKEEIEKLFAEYDFKDYKLLMHVANQGTVKNHNSGLAVAEGTFIKGLGAGDYLHDKHIIRDWIDFLQLSGAEWSISDAIYYDKATGIPVSVPAHPQDMTPYSRLSCCLAKQKSETARIRQLKRQARWNYVVFDDIALGAVMLSTTELQRRYSPLIEAKGIQYAEDNMWRLMMFDGIVPSYYSDKPTIYYEYGGGISTSGSSFWSERLREDWLKADELMFETKGIDAFQRKMQKTISAGQFLSKSSFIGKLARILKQGKFLHMLRIKLKPRMTRIK